jgi:hypothetical protein
MAARPQRCARLVEADVCIGANAKQQQIEAADRGDITFEPCAFLLVIGRAAIEEVHVALGKINPIE